MMRRRYEAYKDVVVRPFFRDHFARLDRQIVLADALIGVQRRSGGAARSRSGAGRHSRLFPGRPLVAAVEPLFRPRIDRILFAATKADHLHHSSHDRLEAILRQLVERRDAARRIRRRHRRRGGAGRGARHPRGPGAARPRPAALDRRHPDRRRDGRRRDVRRRDRGRDLPGRPADQSAGAVQGRGHLPRPRRRLAPRTPISASCASGRRGSTATIRTARRCLTSASTARSSS